MTITSELSAPWPSAVTLIDASVGSDVSGLAEDATKVTGEVGGYAPGCGVGMAAHPHGEALVAIEESMHAVDGVDPLRALQSALEDADELPVTERLHLLQQAEATVSSILEGLDGL